MPYVAAARADLHYVERGADSAEAEHVAVFLHGFTIDHRSMLEAFEPAFQGRADWRRLYLDFPGMGRSPAPDWIASTDDLFAVTCEAIDLLTPGRYAAAGCSFGGYIAQGLAARHPERVTGLALLVPMVVAEHDRRQVPPREVLAREAGLVAVSETLEEIGVVITAETLRRTTAEIDAAAEMADEAAVERIFERYRGTFPLVPAEGTYDGPTLVTMGRQDSVVGYRDQWELLERWPRATFAVLDRAGHNLQIEQPTVFTALVAEWIDRVEENEAR